MNLDQFIKHYTVFENIKLNNQDLIFNCPICNKEVSNRMSCNVKDLGNIINHVIKISFSRNPLNCFIILYLEGDIDFKFNNNFFTVINEDPYKEVIFYYEDFGEITLSKLDKLKNNLLFL